MKTKHKKITITHNRKGFMDVIKKDEVQSCSPSVLLDINFVTNEVKHAAIVPVSICL